jgi:predicted phage terminase large subunit-like protein
MKKKNDALAAAQLLAQRKAVRTDLVAWCRHAGFEPAKHHLLMLKHLTDVSEGTTRRLAICLPPGAAKSTYMQLAAVWFLARNPTKSIIVASHTQSLADRQSIRIRNLIAEHSKVLGIELDPNTTAAERWALKSGGAPGAECRAVGTGVAVTGYRAHRIYVDDALKGIEQAMSSSEKEKILAWYHADLSTRLVPSGALAMAQTRWAVDDLLGRLLDEEGDRWKLLSLPAYAEANDPLGRQIGEPLWQDDPIYNYPAFIAEQKRTLPPRMFVSLFQQAPVNPEGNMFRAEWLRVSRVPPDPDTSNFFIGLDLASSEGRGDYSAIVVISCDMHGDYHVVDVFRKQTTVDVTIDALLDRCRDYRPQFIATERGGLINAAGPFLRSRQIERNIYTRVETVPSRHSKEVRAQSFIGRAAVKGLYLPQQADWLSDFVGELISFPSGGRTDDQVDAIAVIFQVLQNITPGPAPKPKEEVKRLVIGDPQATTLTLTDLFESREKGKGRYRRGAYDRI